MLWRNIKQGRGLVVLGRWEGGQSPVEWGALTEVRFLRLEKIRDGPGYHLQEEYFRQREEKVQRPLGRHMPGMFGDWCLNDSRAGTSQRWRQRNHGAEISGDSF